MPQRDADTIILADLALYARIGLTEDERQLPQRLQITVHVSLFPQPAGAARTLNESVNYAELAHELREWTAAQQWVLVEDLAEKLCSAILVRYSGRAAAVRMLIKKFRVLDAAWAGVEITRAAAK